MGFYDNPIVDDNSKKSEESVLAVKSFFTQKNGFLCRDESPDFGVDVDVELIDENSSVSGKKFAIQIKSTSSVNKIIVENKNYISLSFKTSRLGYIAKRFPGYGIIVLYDESSRLIYFDFIENLISRIQIEKKDDKWIDQSSVNIHLPESQVLSIESINRIYEKLMAQFRNHDLMMQKHGENFGIPVPIREKEHDFVNDLEKNGYLFVNNQDFETLNHIFTNVLTNREIRQSLKLCLYASITFSETGQAIEAASYLNSCKIFSEELTDEEKELISLIDPKIEYLLGNISLEEFGNQVEELSKKVKDTLNIINLKINIAQLKVLKVIESGNYNEFLEEYLLSIFKEISNLDKNNDVKHHLIIYHSDSILSYSNAFITKYLIRQKIREQIQEELSTNQKIRILNRFLRLRNESENMLKKSYLYSENHKKNIIKAEVLFREGKFFLNTQWNLLLLRELSHYSDNLNQIYIAHVNNLHIAYDIFINKSRFREAYFCLNYSLDIQRLYNHIYKPNQLSISTEANKENIKKLERLTGFRKYDSFIDEIIKTSNKQVDPRELIKQSSEREIEAQAKILLEVYGLPKERLINIILDMKSMKKFYTTCKNDDIEILQDLRHLNSKETKYKFQCSYILRSKRSGLETPPSSDVDELLKIFKHLIK